MYTFSDIKKIFSGFRYRTPGSGPPLPIPKPNPPPVKDRREFLNSSEWRCGVCYTINKIEHTLCKNCTMNDILKELENLDGGCYTWEDYEKE